jgi:hypothetical protein
MKARRRIAVGAWLGHARIFEGIEMEIAKNISSLLSIAAAVLAGIGLLLPIVVYLLLSSALGSAQSAVLPQLNAASATLGDAQNALLNASAAANDTDLELANLSSAFAAYSNSSSDMASTLDSIAALPVLSSDSGFAAAASSMSSASQSFADASASLANSTSAVGGTAQSLASMAAQLSNDQQNHSSAQLEIGAAFGSLQLALLLGCCALELFFASVLLLSLSNLVPRAAELVPKKKAEKKD